MNDHGKRLKLIVSGTGGVVFIFSSANYANHTNSQFRYSEQFVGVGKLKISEAKYVAK